MSEVDYTKAIIFEKITLEHCKECGKKLELIDDSMYCDNCDTYTPLSEYVYDLEWIILEIKKIKEHLGIE